MGWESFDVVRFDLGPFHRGQMRIAKSKSAYKSLFTPEPLRAVWVLFSPMVSGWAGGLREKVVSQKPQVVGS